MGTTNMAILDLAPNAKRVIYSIIQSAKAREKLDKINTVIRFDLIFRNWHPMLGENGRKLLTLLRSLSNVAARANVSCRSRIRW